MTQEFRLRGDIDIEPDAYDVVVLGHICRTEGDERSRSLLARAFAALRPGGSVLIADYWYLKRRELDLALRLQALQLREGKQDAVVSGLGHDGLLPGLVAAAVPSARAARLRPTLPSLTRLRGAIAGAARNLLWIDFDLLPAASRRAPCTGPHKPWAFLRIANK